MIASQCLGKWVKDHPHADQAHRVKRYDKQTLVSYCGRSIPVDKAIEPQGGVLCCPDCTGLWRKQITGRLRAMSVRKSHSRPV